jgi:hypothetical protein
MKMQCVKQFIENENYKAALLGAKDFRIGVSQNNGLLWHEHTSVMLDLSFISQLGKTRHYV